jgi:hypothetical protein
VLAPVVLGTYSYFVYQFHQLFGGEDTWESKLLCGVYNNEKLQGFSIKFKKFLISESSRTGEEMSDEKSRVKKS